MRKPTFLLNSLFPLYKLLGDVFKQRFKGWTAYILTGNNASTSEILLP